jgi:hypothetical protein
MALNGPQIGMLRDALLDAFDVNSFDEMLLVELSKSRQVISHQGNLRADVVRVIRVAGMEGWVPKLIQAARTANPGNERLYSAAEALSVSSTRTLPVASLNLEKIVRKGVPFLDPAQFRRRLGRLEFQVCSVELDDLGYGSGVLVGPDFVLTNQHVVSSATLETKIKCRFDFAASDDGTVINPGQVFPAESVFVDESPPSRYDPNLVDGDPTDNECDYALLKLTTDIGNLPAGSRENITADLRGWVALAGGQIDSGDPIFVLQHPQDQNTWKLQPLKLTMGKVLEFAGGGRRLRHDANTLPGSSGSPCFSASLSLVGLHHAGGDSRYTHSNFNQAIPIEKIIAKLSERLSGPEKRFWEVAP